MSVRYIEKDITSVEMGVIAHGVNCSGAMNSGVAKAIRNKWPQVYDRFKVHPKGREVLGEVDFIYLIGEEIVVANCYTQLFYGYGGGKYADSSAIARALYRVCQIADLQNYHVYIPRIGCGLGGLDWKMDVEPIVNELADVYKRINIYVCDLPEN